MARQLTDLPQINANEARNDDLLLLRDVSSQTDKKFALEDIVDFILNIADVDGDIQAAIERMYPVGSVKTFYDNSSHANYLGFTWEKITDYELVAYAYLSGEKTIAKSKNISSVTGGSGTYTVNFSKNMADANYVPFVNGEVGGTGQEIVGVYGKSASSFKYDFCNHSGSATNPSQVNIAVFGRLATPEYNKWRRTA